MPYIFVDQAEADRVAQQEASRAAANLSEIRAIGAMGDDVAKRAEALVERAEKSLAALVGGMAPDLTKGAPGVFRRPGAPAKPDPAPIDDSPGAPRHLDLRTYGALLGAVADAHPGDLAPAEKLGDLRDSLARGGVVKAAASEARPAQVLDDAREHWTQTPAEIARFAAGRGMSADLAKATRRPVRGGADDLRKAEETAMLNNWADELRLKKKTPAELESGVLWALDNGQLIHPEVLDGLMHVATFSATARERIGVALKRLTSDQLTAQGRPKVDRLSFTGAD